MKPKINDGKSKTSPIRMVEVASGTFKIGAPTGDKEAFATEYPEHEVSLNSFQISEHPVRVSDFQEFLREAGYKPSESALYFDGDDWQKGDLTCEDPGYSYTPECPVTCVSFWDALEFAKWLQGKTGIKFRLPTEAEWEVAARAGTSTSRFWGNTMRNAGKYANVSTTRVYKAVSPVKAYSPNPWGLYDMLGNVFEWTASDFHEAHDGSSVRSSISSDLKTYKGGSFNADPALVRCSARAGMPPDLASNQIGFRLCVDTHENPTKTVRPSQVGEEIRKLKFGETVSLSIELGKTLKNSNRKQD